MRLIDADALADNLEKQSEHVESFGDLLRIIANGLRNDEAFAPTIAPSTLRPKGKWILTAHKEVVNCRWNVTAECSECEAEPKEIWAGFFPGVPDIFANDVALDSADGVKLDNFCPNCGADMRGEVASDIMMRPMEEAK